jgi:hypothetical protein
LEKKVASQHALLYVDFGCSAFYRIAETLAAEIFEQNIEKHFHNTLGVQIYLCSLEMA